MPLTDYEKQDYCNHPGSCPFCGDSDIVGDGFEVDDIKAKQEMSCSACDKRWYDVYVLGDIEEIS